MNYGQRFMTLWETRNRTIPKKKKCEKAKWLSEEALRRLDGTMDSTGMSLGKLQEIVMDWEARGLQSMGSQRVTHD